MTLDTAEWQERIHIDVSSNGDERLCGFLYYYYLEKRANNLSSCLTILELKYDSEEVEVKIILFVKSWN